MHSDNKVNIFCTNYKLKYFIFNSKLEHIYIYLYIYIYTYVSNIYIEAYMYI